MAETICDRSSELLGDYVENRLAPAERTAMDAHFETCAACVELLRSYMAIPEIARRATAVNMPPEARERLRQFLAANKSRG